MAAKTTAKKAAAKPAAAEEAVKVVPVADAPEVKAPAKRRAPAAKAAPAVEEDIVIQFAGGQWSLADLKEKVIAAYVAEGHQRGRISKLSLYVKPEEHMAYYVINDKLAGGVDFD